MLGFGRPTQSILVVFFNSECQWINSSFLCLITVSQFELIISLWWYIALVWKHPCKTCVRRHSRNDHNLVFKTNYRLIQVKSIAVCILQYFRPSLPISLQKRVPVALSGHWVTVFLLAYMYLILCSNKNPSWVWQYDLKIHPEDHRMASRGLPTDDKRWSREADFSILSSTRIMDSFSCSPLSTAFYIEIT